MAGRGTSSMPKANGLKKIPGGPSPQESVGWGSTALKEKAVENVYFDHVDDKAKISNYPYIPFALNEYDTVSRIKSELGAEQNNWTVPLTDRDIEYILQKRDQLEKANFDSWAGQKFDLTDPAQVALFKQICPEYFERRKQVIETQVEIQRRVALLKLLGITSMDDLRLAWAIETGRVKPLDVSVSDPAKWREEAEKEETGFVKGFYSLIGWLLNDKGGRKRVDSNPFAAINPEEKEVYDQGMYAKKGGAAGDFGLTYFMRPYNNPVSVLEAVELEKV